MARETALVAITVRHDGASWALWREADGDEPLARDLDVARWLEYQRPDRIKWLIEKHAPSLGEVFTATVKTSARGGRPGRSYYLTEAQVLFLAAKSETTKATAVLKRMIAVFQAARRGELGAAVADVELRYLREKAELLERQVGLLFENQALRGAAAVAPEYLTTQEAAALLGVSERTFERRLAERPGLKPLGRGERMGWRRWSRVELLAWWAGARRGAAPARRKRTRQDLPALVLRLIRTMKDPDGIAPGVPLGPLCAELPAWTREQVKSAVDVLRAGGQIVRTGRGRSVRYVAAEVAHA